MRRLAGQVFLSATIVSASFCTVLFSVDSAATEAEGDDILVGAAIGKPAWAACSFVRTRSLSRRTAVGRIVSI